jgi:3-isopropylmalate/(R)-2-methylmalate dehydratase small subunit
MKTFGGPVLFLDRSDINTDEVIAAKYLTEVEKPALGPHLLEDLKLEGFRHDADAVRQARVIVTRENFGCGSSREHAPWALEANDITVVIAQSFARIFRQNTFNCGMLAIELARDDIDAVFELSRHGTVTCEVDVDAKALAFSTPKAGPLKAGFELGRFDEALVRAGGWVEFADARY